MRMAVALLRLDELERTYAYGDEGAVGQFEHQRVLFAIGRKRHLVTGGSLKSRTVEQVFDVGADDLGAAHLLEDEKLAVDMAYRAVGITDSDGVTRHLDQTGDVAQFLVVHVFHAPPPPYQHNADARGGCRRIARPRAIYSKNANPNRARV